VALGISLDPTAYAASSYFQLTVPWLAVCAGFLLLERLGLARWPRRHAPRSTRPWLDLPVGLLAAAASYGLGELARRGRLLPEEAAWLAPLNALVIFSPVAVVVVAQRLGAAALLLDRECLVHKLTTGFLLGVLGFCLVYAQIAGLAQAPAALGRRVSLWHLAHLPDVFLGAAFWGFVWTRLRGALGPRAALLTVFLLLAAVYVPQGPGLVNPTFLVEFYFTTLVLPCVVLAVTASSCDVVWLTVAWFFMDLAMMAPP
jgi:hypothetical protein